MEILYCLRRVIQYPSRAKLISISRNKSSTVEVLQMTQEEALEVLKQKFIVKKAPIRNYNHRNRGRVTNLTNHK